MFPVEIIEDETFSDFDGALDSAKSEDLKSHVIIIADGNPVVEEDGTFKYEGKDPKTKNDLKVASKMTDKAAEWMFKHLGFPVAFAKKIPDDLLNRNIKELIKLNIGNNFRIVMVDDVITGFNAPSYRPVPDKDLFEQVIFPYKDDVISVYRGAEETQIQLLLDEDLKAEPRKGDIIRFGVQVTNSQSLFVRPQIFLFAYREQSGCGMKSANLVKESNFDPKKDPTNMLDSITNRLENLEINAVNLETALKAMNDHKIGINHLEYINKFFRSKTGEDADFDGITMYEIWAFVIEKAKEKDARKRSELESLAGDILSAFVLGLHNDGELFHGYKQYRESLITKQRREDARKKLFPVSSTT